MDCDLVDFPSRRRHPGFREPGHLLLIPSACLSGIQIGAGRPVGDTEDIASVAIDEEIGALKAFLLLPRGFHGLTDLDGFIELVQLRLSRYDACIHSVPPYDRYMLTVDPMAMAPDKLEAEQGCDGMGEAVQEQPLTIV